MRDPKYQRIKLVKIMEILYRKSDEEHPLTTNQMIYELGQLGILVERRTMYTDIQALKDCGYDIHSKRTQHDSVYWISKRSFDLPELKIIMDCIHSSKFVTESKTEELIDKIADLGGSARGEFLKRNAIHFDTVKHSNESIYKIVDVLERAIEKCKKVTFYYYLLDSNGERVYKHDKKLYIEEPIAMVCNDGNYYLLCYRPEEEYENHIKTFRVDRIDNIAMSDEDISKEGRSSRQKARQYSRGKASPVLNVLDTKQDKHYIMYYLRSMAYNDVFVASHLSSMIRLETANMATVLYLRLSSLIL